MADTAVKKHYDYVQQQIDEQAILDKYNAATIAQFNVQREQNRQAENQFYNEMYNTQKTAMDTIRQSNAAAVASGASRGVQAAQELSSLLGLQQESVASATELAQANRQTAQEETAAVLENILNAYKQVTDDRNQLISRSIEAAQVDADTNTNQQAAGRADTDALQSALKEGTNSYFLELQEQGKDYSKEYSIEGEQSLITATNKLREELDAAENDDSKDAMTYLNNFVDTVKKQYGISDVDIDNTLKANGVSEKLLTLLKEKDPNAYTALASQYLTDIYRSKQNQTKEK